MLIRTLTLLIATLFATASVQAQSILVPHTEENVVYILDPEDGSIIDTFDAAFSDMPVNIIDGFDGELLMSDHAANTIWRLEGDGTLIGEFVVEPVDRPRGIDLLPMNVVVGATADGIVVWNRNGVRRPERIEGNFMDEFFFAEREWCLTTNVRRGNLQAYDAELRLVGETEPGGMIFPAQINSVVIDNEEFCAVIGRNDRRVFLFDLRGRLFDSWEVDGMGCGLVQARNGNVIVSTANGLFEHEPDGTLVRQIADGFGFAYLEFSFNFRR